MNDVANLKVLYLVPPAEQADKVSAYSFLSEEIEVLVQKNIQAVIAVKDSCPIDNRDYIKVCPPPKNILQVFQSVYCLLRYFKLVGPVFLLNPKKCLYLIRYELFLGDLVKSHGVDLIHSHFAWPGGLGGALASQITGVPLLTSLRGMEIMVDESISYGNRRDPFFDMAFRQLLKYATKVTAVSDHIASEAISLGAEAKKTCAIHKGVDTNKFAPRMSDDDSSDEFIVLSVGGLIQRKGMDTVISAFARLEGSAKLTICGKGEERKNLEALADELGVLDRVEFAGQVSREQIADYFSACDVFVLASRQEASGNVLCEALASGKPVITTKSGGPPEYVAHGETGFVIDVNDDNELANCLGKLMNDSDLKTQFSHAARERALRNYDYPMMIEKILTVYRDLAKSGRRV